MRYSDGREAKLDDTVAIDTLHRGRVVACLDRSEYSSAYPEDEWGYLGRGILVDTDVGGLVHYTDTDDEHIALIARGGRSE